VLKFKPVGPYKSIVFNDERESCRSVQKANSSAWRDEIHVHVGLYIRVFRPTYVEH